MEKPVDQEHASAKLPRLRVDPYPHPQQQPSVFHALSLFVPAPTGKLSNLSAYPADSTITTTRFPRMGSYFSLAQWQELELQALIFRHMVVGASVPPELFLLVKKSLVNSPAPYYLPNHFQHYPHYQPAMLHSGFWGRAAMDPEPGRCRRTDGKKWRCSRDVVAGHKYCERHIHRGRNRSRKPVEIHDTTGGGVLKTNTTIEVLPLTAMAGGGSRSSTHFSLSEPSSSIDLLHLNQRNLLGAPNQESEEDGNSGGGRILRYFFDDWPRSESEHTATSVTCTTNLSISMPGNPSSDFSLKLSTATATANNIGVDEDSQQDGNVGRSQLNWASSAYQLGGPLAEALNSSPTSVLHQLSCEST